MKKLAYLIPLIPILLMAGVFYFQSTCDVVNMSPLTLHEVVVRISSERYGSSVTRKVSDLNSGETAHLRFFPPSEAEVDLAFSAGDNHVKMGVLSYYEGGAIKITIDPDLKVKRTVDILKR